MLRNSIIVAFFSFIMASTSGAAILTLGSSNGSVNGFPTVSSAKAKGRHSTYTLRNFAKGEVKYNGLTILNAQVLLEEPEDFGGNVNKAVQILGESQAAALRLRTAITAPIFLITDAFGKARSRFPALNSKGEMNGLIAELNKHKGANLKDLTLFVERSSATLFFEVKSSKKTTQGSSALSEKFFQTLIGLWASKGSKRSDIKIIFK